jgi:hypothetical protein
MQWFIEKQQYGVRVVGVAEAFGRGAMQGQQDGSCCSILPSYAKKTTLSNCDNVQPRFDSLKRLSQSNSKHMEALWTLGKAKSE